MEQRMKEAMKMSIYNGRRFGLTLPELLVSTLVIGALAGTVLALRIETFGMDQMRVAALEPLAEVAGPEPSTELRPNQARRIYPPRIARSDFRLSEAPGLEPTTNPAAWTR
jgi:hypothetical protein